MSFRFAHLRRAALALAQHGDDAAAGVACSLALGQLYRKQGQYAEALEWLERAREGAQALDDGAGVVQAFADIGEVYRLQGEYAAAGRSYEESRVHAQAAAPTITLLAAQANALKGEFSSADMLLDPAGTEALLKKHKLLP